MKRTFKITVSLSTNPATAHIGPFFFDLREITSGANRQIRTYVGTAAMLREYIEKAVIAADRTGVTLEFEDATYRKDFTAAGGLIGTPFAS